MRARPTRFAFRLALVALLAAFAGSCARSLPTAPAASPTSVRGSVSRFNSQHVSYSVVITLASGADPRALAATYGATLLEWDPDEGVASFAPGPDDDPASLLAKLSGDAHVATSEPNALIEPAEARQKSFAFDDGLGTLTSTVEQPAMVALHVPLAQAVSLGAGVKVAILDTGIDPDHPVLVGHVAAAYDFIEGHPGATDVAMNVDTNGDGVVDAAFGHGTHVAGIVAMTAPGAQLLIGRVLDSDGQGDVVTVAAGIRWAVQQGAQVINLSLGSLARSSAIASAIHFAEERGILVIAAAGNWGAEFPQEYPASSEDAAAVAASDVSAAPAPWTSFARYVDVSAPGVAIRSAYPGGVYRLWSGTSMSTPFVSATAALLLSLHPGWERRDVFQRIAATARPLTSVPANEVGKLGCGMLDVGSALQPDAPVGTDFVPGNETFPGAH